LLALGLTSEEASRTVRFGLGRSTTPEEISESLQLLGSI
jgi:cysteine sulfinate desulfinase/cysteine desulfurase-like protein